ncbi:unnamed protein product [Callosobruchus maculatus]|uniref:Nucleolar protein 12 n=1 Tax=Callosobruchus maculatus TaxID=64391 RepID=A0A653C8M4_CALMS|nr:unnamed protein product [Callosobruchus maculatus]
MGKKTKKRDKIVLVFDEDKRREFLTGFRKRKLERKKKAQEKFERELLEERKRIKKEAKESYKKLVTSHRPIPELEKYIEQEYEEEDVTVKVFDFSKNGNSNNSESVIVKDETSSESEDSDKVPGMELKRRYNDGKIKPHAPQILSKKDIKKVVKQEATKSVKKSKVFQRKNKLEKQKAKKKSLQLKREKLQNTKGKSRNKRKNFKNRKEK